ncbi:MAG: hypothetical protein ACLU9S_07625 [Oscillospiraceae bacterium]
MKRWNKCLISLCLAGYLLGISEVCGRVGKTETATAWLITGMPVSCICQLTRRLWSRASPARGTLASPGRLLLLAQISS